jgi:hypothetical protein
VSKGGNYLLNVGPTAEGVIPQASQDILRTIGKWLQVNGESVYETSPSPFFLPDITWRATVKPGKLYLHILNWPGTKFRFEGLENEVTGAYLLANKARVPFRRNGAALEFELPAHPPDPYDSVLVLEVAGGQPKATDGFRADQVPARFDLHAWVARLRGEEIRYNWQTRSATKFERIEQGSNALWWYPYKALEGEYGVEITYACANPAAGSKFRLASERHGAPAQSVLEGVVEKTGGKFVNRKVSGKLLINSETDHIGFELLDSKSASMELHKITLTAARH